MKRETILVKKKEVYSKSHRSKEIYYEFKTALGYFRTKVAILGNFKGQFSDKDFRETQIENVHERALNEFNRSNVYPSDKNLKKLEEERMEEEKQRREEEEIKRLNEQRRYEIEHIDINSIDFEDLSIEIKKLWGNSASINDSEAEGKEKYALYKGIEIKYKAGADYAGDLYKNLKVSNQYIGLSFTIKRKCPNVDINHVLDTSFRFAFSVCKIANKMKNKEIVREFYKNPSALKYKTLRDYGFKVDKETFGKLDLRNLEDIEKLFSCFG